MSEAAASNQRQTVARNLLLANSSNYLEYFLGLLVSMLIARSLGPSDFGVYVFLIWLVSIAVAIANEGLSLSVTKHVAERAGHADHPAASIIIRHFERGHLNRLLVIMAPLALIAFVNSQPSTYGFTFAAFVAFALAASFFFRARHMLRVATFRGLENFWGVAIAPFLITPVNLASAILLYMLEAPLWLYLVQYVVVSAGFYACTRYFLFRRSGYDPAMTSTGAHDNYFRQVDTYNRYIVPSAIFTYLMVSQTEVFFLNLFATSDQVAFFNVGFVLATAIATLVPGVINMVLLPIVSKSMKEGLDRVRTIVEDTMRYQLYLNFLVIGPTILYAETVVSVLFGSDYSAAAGPFLWLVVIFCGANFVSAFNAYLLAANEHKLIFKVSIIGAAFGLICDLVLVYLYGLTGAVLALGLTMAWYVLTRIVPANRQLRARLALSHVLLVLLASGLCTYAVDRLAGDLPGLFGALIGTTLYVLLFSLLYYFSPVLPDSGKHYVREVLARGSA